MRTWIELTIEGKKVSTELSKYLKAASYREALDGEADTLEITLQDKDGLFMGDWFPDRGAMLELTITNERQQMPLGDFYVDEIENTFPPSECKIKATSIPPSSTVKAAEKWRSWEQCTLRKIASDIASGAGLSLYYESGYNPTLDRAEQSDESDLKFLHRLCEDNGLALKLNDKQLIIFDIEKYESEGAIAELVKGSDNIKRFSARATLNEIYSSCQVNFDSGDVDLPLSGLADGGLGGAISSFFSKGGGKTLKLNKRVSSIGDAQRLAKKKLKAKNREETKIQLTLIGDFRLRAGATVKLSKFAMFNGKYLVQRAVHSVGSSGYTTEIEITKVN